MSSLFLRFVIGFSTCLLAQSATAGGFVEIEDAVFGADSNEIDNTWWPLHVGIRSTYFAEGVDECVVDVVDVLPASEQSRSHVGSVKIREVRDEEWLDEDCDMVPDELLESTLDWYAQDEAGNVWYFGEDTVAFDFDECDHLDGLGGCTDGSWEAGLDVVGAGSIAEEGILMLADPAEERGVFYFQEFYEDEATDMAKILNFKDVDTFLYDEVEDCVVIKS
jgi:hypothetical protein